MKKPFKFKINKWAAVLATAVIAAGAGLFASRLFFLGDTPLQVQASAAKLPVATVSRPPVNHRRMDSPRQFPPNRSGKNDEYVAKLLKVTNRLVREHKDLLLKAQKLKAAEIDAKAAKARADQTKYEAMARLFKEDPRSALGESISPSARKIQEFKFGNSPQPWATTTLRDGPLVKAVQDVPTGRSALVDIDGRTFLVREGQKVGEYQVKTIKPGGVVFTRKGKPAYRPLASPAAATGQTALAPRRMGPPPFLTPPASSFKQNVRVRK